MSIQIVISSWTSSARKNLKRKLEADFEEEPKIVTQKDLVRDVTAQIHLLGSVHVDRTGAKRTIHVISEFFKNEDMVSAIVECGAVPVLVKHLEVHLAMGARSSTRSRKGSAFVLGLLAVKPEHQQVIVDPGALPILVDLLKQHKEGRNSQAVYGLVRRAADAITNLAHENSIIKTCVRMEGGIPPLVQLLECADAKTQRAAVGALQTLAFKNDENKMDCGMQCFTMLILMLRSEDSAIHYEAVGVIGNLVHSSPTIKKEVLVAGALQPVIGLLSSACSESQIHED